MLTVAHATSEDYLAGGRAFERLWLAAQADDLAVQPLSSLPKFLAHQERTGGSLLLPSHQRRVARMAKDFRRLVPQIGRRPVLMLLRLGCATPPTVRSLRRGIEDVVMSSE